MESSSWCLTTLQGSSLTRSLSTKSVALDFVTKQNTFTVPFPLLDLTVATVAFKHALPSRVAYKQVLHGGPECAVSLQWRSHSHALINTFPPTWPRLVEKRSAWRSRNAAFGDWLLCLLQHMSLCQSWFRGVFNHNCDFLWDEVTVTTKWCGQTWKVGSWDSQLCSFSVF